MSERVYTLHWLCDTCMLATRHAMQDHVMCWAHADDDECMPEPRAKLVINDQQQPHEVCEHWKAREEGRMSDAFEEFGGSLTFEARVETTAIVDMNPKSLLIKLADDNGWLEEKVSGFSEIIVRYHGCDHRFTPAEVLRALYATMEEARPERTTTVDETEVWECVRGDTSRPLTVHVMECSRCGHTYEHVNGDYEFCPHCRARIRGWGMTKHTCVTMSHNRGENVPRRNERDGEGVRMQATATMTVRLPEDEKRMVSEYAQAIGVSVSEFVRQAAIERIEDAIDLKIAEEAHEELERDPATYTTEEVIAMLGVGE